MGFNEFWLQSNNSKSFNLEKLKELFKEKDTANNPKLEKLFNIFDTDHDGKISTVNSKGEKELESIFSKFSSIAGDNQVLEESEVSEYLAEHNLNKDLSVNDVFDFLGKFIKSNVVTELEAIQPALTKAETEKIKADAYDTILTSTVKAKKLDKEYDNIYAFAKEKLSESGKQPALQEVALYAAELQLLNPNIKADKNIKKGTSINIPAKSIDKKNIEILESKGIRVEKNNYIFFQKLLDLQDTKQAVVLNVIKNSKFNTKEEVINEVYTKTKINLADTGLTIKVGGAPSTLENFITKTLKLDLSSKEGLKIYDRLSRLDQTTLNKLPKEFIAKLSKMRNITFDKLADKAEVFGIILRTDEEIKEREKNSQYRDLKARIFMAQYVADNYTSAVTISQNADRNLNFTQGAWWVRNARQVGYTSNEQQKRYMAKVAQIKKLIQDADTLTNEEFAKKMSAIMEAKRTVSISALPGDLPTRQEVKDSSFKFDPESAYKFMKQMQRAELAAEVTKRLEPKRKQNIQHNTQTAVSESTRVYNAKRELASLEYTVKPLDKTEIKQLKQYIKSITTRKELFSLAKSLNYRINLVDNRVATMIPKENQVEISNLIVQKAKKLGYLESADSNKISLNTFRNIFTKPIDRRLRYPKTTDKTIIETYQARKRKLLGNWDPVGEEIRTQNLEGTVGGVLDIATMILVTKGMGSMGAFARIGNVGRNIGNAANIFKTANVASRFTKNAKLISRLAKADKVMSGLWINGAAGALHGAATMGAYGGLQGVAGMADNTLTNLKEGKEWSEGLEERFKQTLVMGYENAKFGLFAGYSGVLAQAFSKGTVAIGSKGIDKLFKTNYSKTVLDKVSTVVTKEGISGSEFFAKMHAASKAEGLVGFGYETGFFTLYHKMEEAGVDFNNEESVLTFIQDNLDEETKQSFGDTYVSEGGNLAMFKIIGSLIQWVHIGKLSSGAAMEIQAKNNRALRNMNMRKVVENGKESYLVKFNENDKPIRVAPEQLMQLCEQKMFCADVEDKVQKDGSFKLPNNQTVEYDKAKKVYRTAIDAQNTVESPTVEDLLAKVNQITFKTNDKSQVEDNNSAQMTYEEAVTSINEKLRTSSNISELMSLLKIIQEKERASFSINKYGELRFYDYHNEIQYAIGFDGNGSVIKFSKRTHKSQDDIFYIYDKSGKQKEVNYEDYISTRAAIRTNELRNYIITNPHLLPKETRELLLQDENHYYTKEDVDELSSMLKTSENIAIANKLLDTRGNENRAIRTIGDALNLSQQKFGLRDIIKVLKSKEARDFVLDKIAQNKYVKKTELEQLLGGESFGSIKQCRFTDEINTSYRTKDITLDKTSDVIKEYQTNPQIREQINKQVPDGEAACINGKMYCRADNTLVPINLDKATFDRLFPVEERYNIKQGSIGDCYFIAELSGYAATPNGRAVLYSSFRQEGNDIIIKFPGFDNIEIKFENGKLNKLYPISIYKHKGHWKIGSSNAQVTACDGIKMIERAYSFVRNNYTEDNVQIIANDKFLMNKQMQELDGSRLGGGSAEVPYLFRNYECLTSYTNFVLEGARTVEEGLEVLAKELEADPNIFGSASFGKDLSVDVNKGLSYGHQYRIIGYDKNAQIVKLVNPHDSSVYMEIPLELFKAAEPTFSVFKLKAPEVDGQKMMQKHESKSEQPLAENDGTNPKSNTAAETKVSTETVKIKQTEDGYGTEYSVNDKYNILLNSTIDTSKDNILAQMKKFIPEITEEELNTISHYIDILKNGKNLTLFNIEEIGIDNQFMLKIADKIRANLKQDNIESINYEDYKEFISNGKDIIQMSNSELRDYYQKLIPFITEQELQCLVNQVNKIQKGEPRFINTQEEADLLYSIKAKERCGLLLLKGINNRIKSSFDSSKFPSAGIPFIKKELTRYQQNLLSSWVWSGAYSDLIESVFLDNSITIKEDACLYRGINTDHSTNAQRQIVYINYLNQFKEDAIIDNSDRYGSAAQNIMTALDYAQDNSYGFGQYYVLAIKVKKGTKVLDMRNGEGADFDEIVLPPGKYKITKINYKTGIVECEFIPGEKYINKAENDGTNPNEIDSTNTSQKTRAYVSQFLTNLEQYKKENLSYYSEPNIGLRKEIESLELRLKTNTSLDLESEMSLCYEIQSRIEARKTLLEHNPHIIFDLNSNTEYITINGQTFIKRLDNTGRVVEIKYGNNKIEYNYDINDGGDPIIKINGEIISIGKDDVVIGKLKHQNISHNSLNSPRVGNYRINLETDYILKKTGKNINDYVESLNSKNVNYNTNDKAVWKELLKSIFTDLELPPKTVISFVVDKNNGKIITMGINNEKSNHILSDILRDLVPSSKNAFGFNCAEPNALTKLPLNENLSSYSVVSFRLNETSASPYGSCTGCLQMLSLLGVDEIILSRSDIKNIITK